MGTIAARKAANILENAQNVVAIEYMCACQGIDFLAPLKSSAPLQEAFKTIRKRVPKLTDDRSLSQDINTIRELMRSGDIIASVESLTGPLYEN